VLACPDENAINQVALAACYGYVYQIPTNERIVVSPSLSSAFWRKAADLAVSELVLVCTIPVEPGAYSSCRDSAGSRRTAYVRKDSVISGGRNSVTVSKTGGDYADPVTAANNAFAGDTWCVAPQWPDRPCVMAIGTGVFILRETLSIAEGLAVSGNGKGDTMFVADNGIETAVSMFGDVRISDLTIINSQPGRSRTTGLNVHGPEVPGTLAQVHDMALHVSGAAQNVAVTKVGISLEILDSDITAVGQDTTGVLATRGLFPANLTLERSHVSAEAALNEPFLGATQVTMRLVDSHLSGNVFFNQEHSLLEIVGTEIVGNVTAKEDRVRVVITDASIKGDVDIHAHLSNTQGSEQIQIINTNVEGYLEAGGTNNISFDGLRLHGRLYLQDAGFPYVPILRSYLHASTGAAIQIVNARVQVEQSFVQGAPGSPSVNLNGGFRAFSTVFIRPVVPSVVSAQPHCTDSYGEDYELLDASCRPQVP
jgi:hypothetical protein